MKMISHKKDFHRRKDGRDLGCEAEKGLQNDEMDREGKYVQEWICNEIDEQQIEN